MLAILLAAEKAQPPFNEMFYATAATVIPVLFLALLFPGGILYRYSLWATQWWSRGVIAAYRAGNPDKQESYGAAFWALVLPVVVALFLGTLAEVSAFLALYRQHATHSQQELVIWAVVLLTIITATSAVLSMAMTFLTDNKEVKEFLKTLATPGESKSDADSSTSASSEVPHDGVLDNHLTDPK